MSSSGLAKSSIKGRQKARREPAPWTGLPGLLMRSSRVRASRPRWRPGGPLPVVRSWNKAAVVFSRGVEGVRQLNCGRPITPIQVMGQFEFPVCADFVEKFENFRTAKIHARHDISRNHIATPSSSRKQRVAILGPSRRTSMRQKPTFAGVRLGPPILEQGGSTTHRVD